MVQDRRPQWLVRRSHRIFDRTSRHRRAEKRNIYFAYELPTASASELLFRYPDEWVPHRGLVVGTLLTVHFSVLGRCRDSTFNAAFSKDRKLHRVLKTATIHNLFRAESIPIVCRVGARYCDSFCSFVFLISLTKFPRRKVPDFRRLCID